MEENTVTEEKLPDNSENKMTETGNHPVINTGGAGNGEIVGAALVASMFNRRDRDNDCESKFGLLNGVSLSDLRHEVGQTLKTDTFFNGVMSIKDRICDNEKETIKGFLENRLNIKEVECRLGDKIDCFRNDVSEKFCELRRDIDKEKIHDLQDKLNKAETIATILTALGVPTPVPFPSAKKV